MEERKLSASKKLVFTMITLIIGATFVFAAGEILVRTFNPQVICDPRTNYSAKYGMMWPAEKTINNELPGHWKFTYTINRHNNRGPAHAISDSYTKKNIVILGDSNAFGQGVNDKEEFASIMAQQLDREYNVINLSNSGWGLTQEIRRFYDFGILYKPRIVVLQFCRNDPSDNFLFKVTQIENGQFVFKNSTNEINCLKKHLSNSIVQKSSLYNLFRAFTRRYFFHKTILENVQKTNQVDLERNELHIKQNFYNDLLTLFAKDLKSKGTQLIMISVNNELNEHPLIKKKVAELDSLQLLNYQETENWFTHSAAYSSPEGHRWGKKAHRIIGNELVNLIVNNQYSNSSFGKQ
ncbi:MAG: SGNH/GDSL hydrolase family protein [Marinifilaceae bacterium]